MSTPRIQEPTPNLDPRVQSTLEDWADRNPAPLAGDETPEGLRLQVLGPAPCSRACPVGIAVKRYVGLVAEGRFAEALGVIRRDNPFAAVSGFLCHRPCETECAAGDEGKPIPVRALKQLAARVVEGMGQPPRSPVCSSTEGRVAVIGAGPAGLTAARDLRLLGYAVTVLEATGAPGGLLRHAVPHRRLPPWALEADIAYVLAHGVELRLGVPALGPVETEALMAQGFRAVIWATGATRPVTPGQELGPGVYHGLTLLEAWGKGTSFPSFAQAVVFGAGPVGVAVATELAQSSTGSVRLVHHRDVPSLPVDPDALRAADRAGVILATGLVGREIVREGGALRGLRCRAVTLAPGERAGRAIMGQGTDSVDLPADLVVDTRTRLPDLAAWPAASVTPWGTLAVDAGSLATDHPNVYGAGEVVTGPRSLIEAVAHGRAAARAVHRALCGVDVVTGARVTRGGLHLHLHGSPSQRSPWRHLPSGAGEARARPLGVDGAAMSQGPAENEPMGMAEARRCRRCGPCAECVTCSPHCDERLHVDPEGRWVRAHGPGILPAEAPLTSTRARVDAARCRGCGLCEEHCPYAAPRVGLRRAERSLGFLFQKRHALVATVDPRSCRGCGICVGLCPTGAMGQGGFGSVEVRNRLDALLPLGEEVP